MNLAAGTFFVRDGVTTTDAQGRSATWKLYRIPIRQPTAVINTPTLRLMQHLRITLATPTDAGGPTSSRGSRWRGCGSSVPLGPGGRRPRSSA